MGRTKGKDERVADVVGLLDGIEDASVRHMAACVVWWDVYSNHPYTDRRPEFDKFLNDPLARSHIQRVSATDLTDALIRVGYDPSEASRRVFFDMRPGAPVGTKSYISQT